MEGMLCSLVYTQVQVPVHNIHFKNLIIAFNVHCSYKQLYKLQVTS